VRGRRWNRLLILSLIFMHPESYDHGSVSTRASGVIPERWPRRAVCGPLEAGDPRSADQEPVS
jgi:hypothetical protein